MWDCSICGALVTRDSSLRHHKWHSALSDLLMAQEDFNSSNQKALNILSKTLNEILGVEP